MSYSWRKTFGRVDCRPKVYKEKAGRYDKYPSPPRICSKKCIYSIFCKLELNHMTLGERVKKIKLIFQKPYYFPAILPDGNILLVFENQEGERLSFRGKCFREAIEEAEWSIEQKRKMGTLKIEDPEEEKSQPEVPEETQENKTPIK